MTSATYRTPDRTARTWAAYAFLAAILVAVHFVLAANPQAARSAAQAQVFAWPMLGATIAAGLVGVAFLDLTALPGLWDRTISIRDRIVLPAAAGLLLGGLEAVTDFLTGWGAAMARDLKLSSIHIAWPLSAPIYLGGAVLVSILYFLALIPPITWLVSSKLLKGRALDQVYWLIALPLALVEPLTQDLAPVARLGGSAAAIGVEDLMLNLAQVFFLRRAGFLAAVLVRVAFYAVWHLAWGGLHG